MANPQKENGYTAIANEILEKILETQFNATQLKILMMCWRYTYGFQRKDAEISETFIANKTGISKRYISSALKELIDRKILIVVKPSDYTTPRTISFNKNYEQWIDGTEVQQVNNTSTLEQQSNTTVEQYFNTTDEQLFNQEIKHKENYKEKVILLSNEEAELIQILSDIKGYPLDREKEIDMYKRLTERYPNTDILAVVKEWAISKLDKPLKTKDSPRSQINTWCGNANKWGKNLRAEPNKPKETTWGWS